MSREIGREFQAAAQAQASAVNDMVHAARGVAVIDAATVIGAQCATCDGFMCLDCVDGHEHAKCTRACPDCLIENVDWDEALEMSQIVTELRGLHALDDAIAAMDREEAEQNARDQRGDLSA
ncbi:MAG: hypothetical protein Q4G51_08250 [Dermatophilus congolensis]|nr:hypothetical protein [Dermatophilus congolensis]